VLANVLLVNLGFDCMVAHLEPTAVAFGAACSAACVVTVDSESTR